VAPKEIKGKANGHTTFREAHACAMDRGDCVVEEANQQHGYLNDYRVALLE
jgi:hypothetical protein